MNTRVCRVLCLAIGAIGIGTLAFTIAARMRFDWPLEWMEGASLHHALRLWRGEPVYAPPSADFIAYLYPPLSYLPMAVSSALFGPSLIAARLPSVLALVGTLVLVGRVCARHGGGWPAGLAGAGLFAAGYGYAGAFLDLARVDALFILLCTAGAERLDAQRPRTALVWLCAACFAKQHGALFLLAASLWLLGRDARQHRVAVGAAWLTSAVLFGALTLTTGGWFARYVLALPASHGTRPHLLASFVLVDLLVYLPALAIAAGIALWRHRRHPRAIDALCIAGIVAGALGRAHPGGEDNVRLPALLMLVMVGTPVMTHALWHAVRARARVLSGVALSLQTAWLWQPPSAHAPGPASAAGFERLTAALQRCAHGGRSVALDHALLTSTPFVHTMALWDVEQGAEPALAAQATNALVDALQAQDAPAAIAVGRRSDALSAVLRARYRECARVPAPPLATGHQPGIILDRHLVQVIYSRDENPESRSRED